MEQITRRGSPFNHFWPWWIAGGLLMLLMTGGAGIDTGNVYAIAGGLLAVAGIGAVFGAILLGGWKVIEFFTPKTERCLRCGEPRAGSFCPRCGAKLTTKQ